MTPIFKPNLDGYTVLTPNGFKSFAGVSLMNIKPIIRLEFEKNVWIECTFDHKLYISDTEYKTAAEFKIGDTVVSSVGDLALVNKIDLNRVESVYDLIEVEGGHRYYANGVLSSNCEFLVFDETLIDSIVLASLEGKEPIMKMGQARWYRKINPKNTYLISLDPSLGTGGNSAGLQIIEIPSFEQVAEWQHNLTTIQAQVRIMRDLASYINEECIRKGGQASIYYSVENNTIGEAALVAINELGEETIPGLFLSEPIKKGHVRRFRKGFNTTSSSKINACAKLKHMVESGRLKINSKAFISELKAYIAKGVGFEAKVGAQDDLVSSMLLAIRMALVLQEWDSSIYDKLREEREDEFIMPMPIYISTY